MALHYYFRMSCGQEDRESVIFGPFPDYMELTYTSLRHGPDGEFAAEFCNDGWWRAVGGSDDNYYSDIAIWAEEAA